MITISIVTYKTKVEELSKCFESLVSPLVLRIYVVDNSSQDYIAEFCKQYENVKYIASENVGYGAGHNVAIRRAIIEGSTYHLVLNSDVYFKPDILESIKRYMDDNLDVAQLIPNTVYPNGKLQYVCRLLPTPLNLVFRRFMPKKLAMRMDKRFLLKNYSRQYEMDVPFLLGSFMFFRTDCFKLVGMFDENIFMYMEDIDISRRMHKYFRTVFWPEVTIVHAHKGESYKNKKMMFIHIKSAIHYFNKWGWIFDKERSRWNRLVVANVDRDNELNINKLTIEGGITLSCSSIVFAFSYSGLL